MAIYQAPGQSPVGRLIYPMRIMGYLLASLNILMFYYLELEELSTKVWIGVAVLMAYPHVLFVVNRWKGYARNVELFGLIFDMFLIGWIAGLLKFSPAYAMPYVMANSATNFATDGPRLLWQGGISLGIGVLMAVLLLGTEVYWLYNGWVSIPGFIYLLAATHYIGFVSYVKGNAIRKAKNQVEQTSLALYEQKEELLVLNEEIRLQSEEILSQKDSMEAKNREVSGLYHRVRESINYAQRIQQTLLPSESVMKSVFPEHFILYKPRDVVSGDFYWMHTAGTKTWLVVADCTGHGVPGAFMSLVNQMFLQEIVVLQGITDICQALEKIDQHVIDAFHKYDEEKEGANFKIQEGMDMGIIQYDTETKELQFAGAKHSLLMVENGISTRITGNKRAIGRLSFKKDKEQKPFTAHSQIVEPHTWVYMCSDGFADQFGGSERKKIGRKRMDALLVELASLPASDQQSKLDGFLTQWMEASSESQIDDVLVLGVGLS